MDTPPGRCWHCKESGEILCNRCLFAVYCSQPCLQKDENRHLEECENSSSAVWPCNFCGRERPFLYRCQFCHAAGYCSSSCHQLDEKRHTPTCVTIRNSTLSIAQNLLSLKLRARGIPQYIGRQGHAVDLLSLSRNELGKPRRASVNNQQLVPHIQNLRLLLLSGDFKHVLQTLYKLPSDFVGNVEFYLNDSSVHILARNMVFIYLLFLDKEGDSSSGSETIAHILYSLYLSELDFLILTAALENLVDMTYQSIFETFDSKIQVNLETWSLMREIWQGWLHLCDDTSQTLQDMLTVMWTKMNTGSNADILEKYLSTLPSGHVDSVKVYVHTRTMQDLHGLCFPNVSLNCFNPFIDEYAYKFQDLKVTDAEENSWKECISVTTKMVYSPHAIDVVFQDWDYQEVLASVCYQPNCVEMYLEHIVKVISRAKELIHKGQVKLTLDKENCFQVAETLRDESRFDRIATHAMADIYSSPLILQCFGPLLNAFNPCSTLLTHHRVWTLCGSGEPMNYKDILRHKIQLPEFQRSLIILSKRAAGSKWSMFKRFLQAELMSYLHKSKNIPLAIQFLPSYRHVRLQAGLQMADFSRCLNTVIPFKFETNERTASMTDGQMYSLEWRIASISSPATFSPFSCSFGNNLKFTVFDFSKEMNSNQNCHVDDQDKYPDDFVPSHKPLSLALSVPAYKEHQNFNSNPVHLAITRTKSASLPFPVSLQHKAFPPKISESRREKLLLLRNVVELDEYSTDTSRYDDHKEVLGSLAHNICDNIQTIEDNVSQKIISTEFKQEDKEESLQEEENISRLESDTFVSGNCMAEDSNIISASKEFNANETSIDNNVEPSQSSTDLHESSLDSEYFNSDLSSLSETETEIPIESQEHILTIPECFASNSEPSIKECSNLLTTGPTNEDTTKSITLDINATLMSFQESGTDLPEICSYSQPQQESIMFRAQNVYVVDEIPQGKETPPVFDYVIDASSETLPNTSVHELIVKETLAVSDYVIDASSETLPNTSVHELIVKETPAVSDYVIDASSETLPNTSVHELIVKETPAVSDYVIDASSETLPNTSVHELIVKETPAVSDYVIDASSETLPNTSVHELIVRETPVISHVVDASSKTLPNAPVGESTLQKTLAMSEYVVDASSKSLPKDPVGESTEEETFAVPDNVVDVSSKTSSKAPVGELTVEEETPAEHHYVVDDSSETFPKASIAESTVKETSAVPDYVVDASCEALVKAAVGESNVKETYAVSDYVVDASSETVPKSPVGESTVEETLAVCDYVVDASSEALPEAPVDESMVKETTAVSLYVVDASSKTVPKSPVGESAVEETPAVSDHAIDASSETLPKAPVGELTVEETLANSHYVADASSETSPKAPADESTVEETPVVSDYVVCGSSETLPKGPARESIGEETIKRSLTIPLNSESEMVAENEILLQQINVNDSASFNRDMTKHMDNLDIETLETSTSAQQHGIILETMLNILNPTDSELEDNKEETLRLPHLRAEEPSLEDIKLKRNLIIFQQDELSNSLYLSTGKSGLKDFELSKNHVPHQQEQPLETVHLVAEDSCPGTLDLEGNRIFFQPEPSRKLHLTVEEPIDTTDLKNSHKIITNHRKDSPISSSESASEESQTHTVCKQDNFPDHDLELGEQEILDISKGASKCLITLTKLNPNFEQSFGSETQEDIQWENLENIEGTKILSQVEDSSDFPFVLHYCSITEHPKEQVQISAVSNECNQPKQLECICDQEAEPKILSHGNETILQEIQHQHQEVDNANHKEDSDITRTNESDKISILKKQQPLMVNNRSTISPKDFKSEFKLALEQGGKGIDADFKTNRYIESLEVEEIPFIKTVVKGQEHVPTENTSLDAQYEDLGADMLNIPLKIVDVDGTANGNQIVEKHIVSASTSRNEVKLLAQISEVHNIQNAGVANSNMLHLDQEASLMKDKDYSQQYSLQSNLDEEYLFEKENMSIEQNKKTVTREEIEYNGNDKMCQLPYSKENPVEITAISDSNTILGSNHRSGNHVDSNLATKINNKGSDQLPLVIEELFVPSDEEDAECVSVSTAKKYLMVIKQLRKERFCPLAVEDKGPDPKEHFKGTKATAFPDQYGFDNRLINFSPASNEEADFSKQEEMVTNGVGSDFAIKDTCSQQEMKDAVTARNENNSYVYFPTKATLDRPDLAQEYFLGGCRNSSKSSISTDSDEEDFHSRVKIVGYVLKENSSSTEELEKGLQEQSSTKPTRKQQLHSKTQLPLSGNLKSMLNSSNKLFLKPQRKPLNPIEKHTPELQQIDETKAAKQVFESNARDKDKKHGIKNLEKMEKERLLGGDLGFENRMDFKIESEKGQKYEKQSNDFLPKSSAQEHATEIQGVQKKNSETPLGDIHFVNKQRSSTETDDASSDTSEKLKSISDEVALSIKRSRRVRSKVSEIVRRSREIEDPSVVTKVLEVEKTDQEKTKKSQEALLPIQHESEDTMISNEREMQSASPVASKKQKGNQTKLGAFFSIFNRNKKPKENTRDSSPDIPKMSEKSSKTKSGLTKPVAERKGSRFEKGGTISERQAKYLRVLSSEAFKEYKEHSSGPHSIPVKPLESEQKGSQANHESNIISASGKPYHFEDMAKFQTSTKGQKCPSVEHDDEIPIKDENMVQSSKANNADIIPEIPPLTSPNSNQVTQVQLQRKNQSIECPSETNNCINLISRKRNLEGEAETNTEEALGAIRKLQKATDDVLLAIIKKKSESSESKMKRKSMDVRELEESIKTSEQLLTSISNFKEAGSELIAKSEMSNQKEVRPVSTEVDVEQETGNSYRNETKNTRSDQQSSQQYFDTLYMSMEKQERNGSRKSSVKNQEFKNIRSEATQGHQDASVKDGKVKLKSAVHFVQLSEGGEQSTNSETSCETKMRGIPDTPTSPGSPVNMKPLLGMTRSSPQLHMLDDLDLQELSKAKSTSALSQREKKKWWSFWTSSSKSRWTLFKKSSSKDPLAESDSTTINKKENSADPVMEVNKKRRKSSEEVGKRTRWYQEEHAENTSGTAKSSSNTNLGFFASMRIVRSQKRENPWKPTRTNDKFALTRSATFSREDIRHVAVTYSSSKSQDKVQNSPRNQDNAQNSAMGQTKVQHSFFSRQLQKTSSRQSKTPRSVKVSDL